MKKLSVSITRREAIWGWGYLLFQIFFLPVILTMVNMLLPSPMPEAKVNFVYFLLNFLSILAIAHQFLWDSLRIALRSPFRCLRAAFLGLVLYFACNILFSNLIVRIRPDFININDNSISAMTQGYFTLVSIGTIFLVPPAEEFLYRGLVFGLLYNKNKFLAYGVSTVLFSAIHVVGYIGSYDLELLLLCFIQYIPAGICLAWAYASADTIFAPILMHITINQIGMQAMR